MTLVDQAPPRTRIVTRGRNWARRAQISAALVAVALVGVGFLLWAERDTNTPDQVVREFLTTTSCARLHELSTDSGDRLLQEVGCESMIGAANGQRTYAVADPAVHKLARTLHIGKPKTKDGLARLDVTVTYADTTEPDRLMVQLQLVGRRWEVLNWGLLPQ